MKKTTCGQQDSCNIGCTPHIIGLVSLARLEYGRFAVIVTVRLELARSRFDFIFHFLAQRVA